jgi:hypothetical protein
VWSSLYLVYGRQQGQAKRNFRKWFFLNKKKRIKPTTNALLCLYFVLLKIEKQEDE